MATEPRTAESWTPARPATILVVDDEEMLRELLARALRAAGYTVLEASHGAEAWQLVEQAAAPIDLVITDVVMPEIDGRELGRRLAQRAPTLPVLYISAYQVNDIFSRGAPDRSMPFLRKPFEVGDLLASVRQLLEHPGRVGA